MRNHIGFYIFTLFWFLMISGQELYACRFWCALGENQPQKIMVKQLLQSPHSLKILGKEYSNGWSVGYYREGEPVIYRGSDASNIDHNFDKAVHDVAQNLSHIIFSHLRRASSGCVEGVPNPHPFQRTMGGKHWIFGHNGGIKKQLLIDLIGKEYLETHSPTTCAFDPPDSWIDSELYFIFLLKNIEENAFDVNEGLKKGLAKLYEAIGEKNKYLNFFLSDGKTLWAFRKGNTLFYHDDQKEGVTIISSTIPDDNEKEWQAFPEDTIAEVNPSSTIKFFPIFNSGHNSGDTRHNPN